MTSSHLRAQRQKRQRRGRLSELVAAALLIAKGYRVLARRYATSSGEIDLIACRRRRLVFVEVKRRPTLGDCEASILPRQRQRIRRAADLWLARHPGYRNHDIAFDAVFLTARGWPMHRPDAL